MGTLRERENGEWTRLDPPVVVGAKAFSIGLRLASQATHGETLVRAGKLARVDVLGGGEIRLVMQRGMQQSSRTVVSGFGDSSEVVTHHLGGGNIVAPHEAQRVISHANAMARNGWDVKSRVVPGMTCSLSGGVSRWNVRQCAAYAVSPIGGVNYNGEAPTPTIARPVHEVGGLELTRAGWAEEVELNTSGSGLLGDCVVLWTNSGSSTSGACTEEVFEATPDLYPADATFGAGQRYHFDSLRRVLRFGSEGLEGVGADGVGCLYWGWTSMEGVSVPVASAGDPRVLVWYSNPDGAVHRGYGGTTDHVVGAGIALTGSLDAIIIVEGGEGAIELREAGGGPGGRVLALAFNDGIVELVSRAEAGETAGRSALGVALSAPYEIRVQWDGSSVVWSYRGPGGGAWTSLDPIAFANTGGTVAAVTTWEVARFRNAGTLQTMRIGGAGRFYTRLGVGAEWRGSVAYGRGATTSITEVYNETTGEAMSAYSTERRRDTYDVDGDDVVLFAETCGDKVRVTSAAAGSAPPTPGMPARVFNQVNFSTESGTPGVATTDPGENYLNWHDEVIISDPHGTFDGVPGDDVAFHVMGDGGDDGSPAEVFYDVRGRAGAAVLTPVPDGEWLAFWPNRILLLSADFESSLGLQGYERLCVYASGHLYESQVEPQAADWMEPVRAIQAFDQGWCAAGVAQGEASTTVSGYTPKRLGPYPSDWACVFDPENPGSHAWVPSALAYGIRKSDQFEFTVILEAHEEHFPFYFRPAPDFTLTYIESSHGEEWYGYDDETLYCPEGSGPGLGVAERQAMDDCDPGAFMIAVHPQDIVPPSGLGQLYVYDGSPADIYFGSYPAPSGFVDVAFEPEMFAEFGFRGIPFNPGAVFANLPAGATLQQVLIPVRAAGLRSVSWSLSWVRQADDSLEVSYSVNGTEVYTYEGPRTGGGTAWALTPAPAPAAEGGISFVLIGRRIDSQQIRLVGGELQTVTRSQNTALGGGLAGASAVRDEWAMVDATGTFAALHADGGSARTVYELWPTVGTTGVPTQEEGALAGILRSNLGEMDVELIPGAGAEQWNKWGQSCALTGRYVWAEELAIGVPLMRYTLAGEVIEELIPELVQPPLIAALG